MGDADEPTSDGAAQSGAPGRLGLHRPFAWLDRWFAARSKAQQQTMLFVTRLAWIGLLVWVGWYVGIRTRDPPAFTHSLGVVARAVGSGRTVAAADNPSGHPCLGCVHDPLLIRFDPGDGLRVDMAIKVDPTLWPWPSCGVAHVDMVISGTQGFWEQHDLTGMTQIALGWDSHTVVTPQPAEPPRQPGSPALVAFYGDPQSPLHPGLLTYSDLTSEYAHNDKVSTFPPGHPFGLRTQIIDWSGPAQALHQYQLNVRFDANWVVSRGFGSCYVLIPSLLANGAFAGTQNALNALTGTALRGTHMVDFLDQVLAPSYGRVELTGGSLSLSDTSPPPTDYQGVYVPNGNPSAEQRAHQYAGLGEAPLGPVWACAPSDDLDYLNGRYPLDIPAAQAFPGNACGVVAVVDANGASSFRAVFLIVIGILIAVALDGIPREFRWAWTWLSRSPTEPTDPE